MNKPRPRVHSLPAGATPAPGKITRNPRAAAQARKVMGRHYAAKYTAPAGG